mmetsp:Transcript_43714/g.109759  ORF Transcript_43714/g.109759 Transcript_43714/m.109759 type:complete len:856 (-) Transcript_43714:14-2581(-)
MVHARRAATALLALIAPACGQPTCLDGGAAGCLVDEDSSLLALRHQQREAGSLGARGVECPGSPGTFCDGNQCCPGTEASGYHTFPCPTADASFDGCEMSPSRPSGQVECPGSPGTFCEGNQCCPGTHSSDNKTFPCPTAEASFVGCEGGHEELVSALLGAMSREEKYRFIRGTGWKNGTYETLPGYYIGEAGLHEKFGIPSLNMEDNGQGFRTVAESIIGNVTSWPVTLAVASSWSESDTQRFGVALGQEFRIKGANGLLGPGVNVARVARCGRNAEYISGEEPYLGARLVVPYVIGVQSQKVLAVVKHYINNNQEDHRDTVDAIVDNRTEWEVYYPPFQAAVSAGVGVVMCSYNLVNGVHACGNPDTLLTDLKDKMGFEGWVQSDWWAVHSFVAEQGVDQEMPGDSTPSNDAWFLDANLDTLSDGKVDDMVGRMLRMMLRHGLFEPSNKTCQPLECNSSLYDADATSPEHDALNQELATKAIMLLKNEGRVLPLQPNVTLAVLGSACDAPQDVEAQLAQWDLGSYYNIGGSGRVIAHEPISIYAGLKTKCMQMGCTVVSGLTDNATEAVKVAAEADVAIICGATTSTEGHDRANLSVDQEDFMVSAASGLKAAGKPIVSLTITPGSIVLPWVDDVQAVLSVFLAGKYTGTAFADTLFGDSNPSAKSPLTFPVQESDMVAPCPEDSCPYTEGLFVGWRALEGKPVTFPFGHGLSYTSFNYSMLGVAVGLEASSVTGCTGAAVCISARISNTGSVKGSEVAQLYMGFPENTGEPTKVLRGFVRVEDLEVGASADVAFPLYENDLRIYSEADAAWTLPNGHFNLYAAASSRDVRFDSAFAACNGQLTLGLDQPCMG